VTGFRLRAPEVLAGALSAERLALSRTAVGVTMITRPRTLPRVLGVDSATASRMAWSAQMLGAREVALGLGAFVALRRPDRRAARLWLLAGLLSDAVDALAVGAAAAQGRVSKVTGTGLVAVAGAAVYAQLDALQDHDEA
jgi:peptide-methionine (R)-S-oxide reductase